MMPTNYMESYVWMEEYFDNLSQWNPQEAEAEVKIKEKQDAYVAYSQAFAGKDADCFSQRRFYEVWSVLFVEYVQRTWCDIPGHCHTCRDIEDLHNKSNDAVTHRALKEAHQLHRGGLFMKERYAYKARCFEAIFQPEQPHETVLSFITDAMDTQKNDVPKEGTHAGKNCVTQHITGVKVHGHGVNFYTTFGNISGKSPDVTIYIISKEIEKFKLRNNGRTPEKIYVQADGGGENANRFVLAFLEMLVAKRIVREVWFTRLPVGHTHEDIDGVFGVIARLVGGRVIYTIIEYQTLISQRFKASGVQCKFEDVFVVPNYVSVLSPHIDPQLSGLHKTTATQLQWRFEAIDISSHFPNGVKTCYRAYSSSKVYI